MERASRAGHDEPGGIITPRVSPDALLGSLLIAAIGSYVMHDFSKVALILPVDIMPWNVIEQERIRELET